MPVGGPAALFIPKPRRNKGTYQPSLGFNERSVLTVHFVVEPAGVTQVMPGAVSSPERGSSGSTVHTLSAF